MVMHYICQQLIGSQVSLLRVGKTGN